jgi:hypothetical protein
VELKRIFARCFELDHQIVWLYRRPLNTQKFRSFETFERIEKYRFIFFVRRNSTRDMSLGSISWLAERREGFLLKK